MEVLLRLVAAGLHLLAVSRGVSTEALVVGTPFRSVPYRYGPAPEGAVLRTPRFLVVIEGAECTGGSGGGGLTVAGRDGFLPRTWFDAHCEGEHAGTVQRRRPDGTLGPPERRVYLRHRYAPAAGVATVTFFGRTLTLHSEGRKMRVAEKEFDLPAERAVVVMDREGKARLAPAARAKALRERYAKEESGATSEP